MITQLDDINDRADTAEHRYFVAHRLLVHPPGHTTIALWEGEIIAGPGRQLEPWYANILNLGLLAQYDRGSPSNSLVGVDVTTRVLHTRTFASLLIDDFQIDRGTASDKEPPAYGLTIGAEGGLGAAAWTAFYTRVTNLTYRTPNPAEAVMDRGDGLGRNFSDYDQVTIRGSVIAGPGLLLSPEATLLRQGQGDFRLPYPAVAAYASTPTFLAGVVERTLRLALGANLDRASWGLAANGGVHLEHNAGHVSGASRTRWIGSVAFTYRFHRESPLP